MKNKLPTLALYLFTVCSLFPIPNANADEGKTVPIIGKVHMDVRKLSTSDRRKLESVLGKEGYTLEYKMGPTAQNEEKSYPVEPVKTQKIGDANLSQIAQVIQDVRDSLCKALRKGDEIKFTVAWDTSIKIFGLGGDASTGIDVTIKCG